MLTRLTEFDVPGGGTVIVETTEPTGSAVGVEKAGRADDLAQKASKTFDQALDDVRPAIDAIAKKVHEIAAAADELQVEFGITLSGELGGVVAKAGAEANFAVTITWKRADAVAPSE